jgi:DNA-binding NarL/FixJ family response regulator
VNSHPTPPQTDQAQKRVLIVDDHALLRLGLTEYIKSEPGLAVCGAVASVNDALIEVERETPDLVVTDLDLHGKSGLDLIKALAGLHPELPVIVLSLHDEEVFAERCLRAGARGYVMKHDSPEQLGIAIRKVLDGGIHVSEKTSARILNALSGNRGTEGQSPMGLLTSREFELFQWIGRGLSTKDIAERLQVSPKTIESHRLNIKAKLGLSSASELIAFAARWAAAEE